MNPALQTMLASYAPQTADQYTLALREILQEIVLRGLYRGGFFSKAAFYGGTCLRIFHGLPRFSEDLDFSLLNVDPTFDTEDYLPVVRDEIASWGFHFRSELSL